MCFIILSHYSLFGNWSSNLSPLYTTKLLMFDPLGPAGAVIFFIITGYFAYNTEINIILALRKEVKRVIRVWGQTFFYSITILILFLLLGLKGISLVQISVSVFPFITNEYWFVSAYIMLCLISPYLVTTINNISNRSFQLLLLVLIVLNFTELFGNSLANNLLLAVLGFFIGMYLRINLNKIQTLRISWLISSIFIIYLIELLSIFILSKFGIGFGHAAHFSTDTLAVLMATCLFILFSRINIGSIRLVNLMASTVFAAYLITEQVLMRPIIWSKVFNVARFQNNLLFPIYGIVIVICVMFITFIIDIIRKLIIKYIVIIYKGLVQVF